MSSTANIASPDIPNPSWTLEEAIVLARRVESIVIPLGYHIALGGSTLHSGRSDKDVDLLVYAHDPINGTHDKAAFLKALDAVLTPASLFQTTPKYVNRDVVIADIGGRRVDFFFL